MERVDYESLVISDLLSFYSAKQLDINPWYQRRSVWSTPQKAYLINTIFERKPVPSTYIRQKIDLENEKTVKEVVDGQQRIRTILAYRADEFPARHPVHNKKLSYSQLSPHDRGAFLTTPLSVGYLIGATDQDVIEIFGRINSVSKTLNPMEKLNAQYSGEFKQFCLKQAASRLPFWRSAGLFTANEISRMQELQFVSDLVVNLIQGLSDYSASQLAAYYKKYDESFPMEEEVGIRLESIFQKLVCLDVSDFTDTIFKSAQLVFSLMMVIDAAGADRIKLDKMHRVMRDIDTQVTAYLGDRDLITDAHIVVAFTGGNLHRIRSRSVRHDILMRALA